MAIIWGRTGSDTTYLLFKILLEPGFFDYNNLIIYTTTPEQTFYQFLRHGLNNNLRKLGIRLLHVWYEKRDDDDEDIGEICKVTS